MAYLFTHTMRWYGPDDSVSLRDIRQCGATGVVTALHHVPNGEVWTKEEIEKRKSQVEEEGLEWKVVESLPITENMKLGLPQAKREIENYKISMRHLAEAGIEVITYNFMPILDWTRTRLYHELEDGSLALYFNIADLAAFDLYILKREDAEEDYTPEILKEARELYEKMSEEDRITLTQNILAGLPGSEAGYALEDFRERLAMYDDITADDLRNHLIGFLKEVVPVAEELGLKMAIHPDDPPFEIFGVPRIVSTEEDYDHFIEAVPSLANGLCFCAGSLGATPENDIQKMIRKYKDRIHFMHLRSVEIVSDRHFYEADHLEGNADMVSLIEAFVDDSRRVPIRPDHGHAMLQDLENKKANPGYTAIGRMKGLRAIQGIEMALTAINGKKR